MPEQPVHTRRRDKARVNALTSGVGVSAIAGARVVALTLPGSAHRAASGTLPSTSSTTSTATATATTETTSAPQSAATESADATSGGS
jgi:hypothetical protein